MKLILVGIWAVCVTLGTSYAVASFKMGAEKAQETPRLEGLQYASLPTMSVPVVQGGKVQGYVVLRMVYTANSAVLNKLAAKPDPFISDEMFRALYGRAEVSFGRLARLDLAGLADEARQRVNERMGDEVVQDLLVDGLNYVDLAGADPATAAALAQGQTASPGRTAPQPSGDTKTAADAAHGGGNH